MSSLVYLADLTQCLTELLGKKYCFHKFKVKIVIFFYWLLHFSGASIDVCYSKWLSWLFTPLIAVSLLPGIIIILLYITSSLLYIYKLHR